LHEAGLLQPRTGVQGSGSAVPQCSAARRHCGAVPVRSVVVEPGAEPPPARPVVRAAPPACTPAAPYFAREEERPLIKKSRPKYLDLTEIKMPTPALVSILHRASGIGLYLVGIPLGLYLFQMSLASEQGYAQFAAIAGHWFVKLIFLGLLWAFLHHFCAGIRYLTLDMHMGEELQQARSTSYAVLAVSLVLTLVLGVQLW
jgi:succinate dehydrogenase / fumarate reductase cytochrome b subunit